MFSKKKAKPITTPINVHYAQCCLRKSMTFSYRNTSVQSKQKSPNQQKTKKNWTKNNSKKTPPNQQKIAQTNKARNKKNLNTSIHFKKYISANPTYT